jgi:adenosylcobyric acid synthase
MDAEGRTLGTYVHGLFHNEGLRRGILAQLASWKGVRLPKGAPSIDADKELDRLAHLVRRHLDMDLVFEIAGVERRRA